MLDRAILDLLSQFMLLGTPNFVVNQIHPTMLMFVTFVDMLPHTHFASDSPWDLSILDDEFEEVRCDAILADPQVQECCKNRDAHIDDFGFL